MKRKMGLAILLIAACGNSDKPQPTPSPSLEGEIEHRLIKAVQELSAKNDALEARLAALEGKVG